MGAVLVCFGDREPDFSEIRQRRKRLSIKNSLLDRFEKTWSDRGVNEESPASSGSRMLSAFYSRLLEENDDCAYYFDSSGKRLKEANFYRVELFDDYFMRWERSQKKCNEPAPSPIKSLEMECFSTSSTVASECDCWASTDSLFPWVQQVPVLRRCSSLQSVVTKVEMHRTNTGPYLQKATYNAIAQQSQSTPILGLAVTAS